MPRVILAALFILCTAGAAVADDADREALRACLMHWGQHPFNAADPSYRTIAPSVKVFGIGGRTEDREMTAKPDLVLVRSSVNVFSKGTLDLMNPNGWYCLQGKVAVFSKVEIRLHCHAHLASSSDGATVMASNQQSDGVTVFGKSQVTRVGCAAGSSN